MPRPIGVGETVEARPPKAFSCGGWADLGCGAGRGTGGCLPLMHPEHRFFPEDYAIGTFSVHLARRIRKWAGSCSVLSLASGSGRIGGYAPAHRDGRTRWAGDEASAFAKQDRFFALNPTAECVDSSIGVHPLQNMVANNRPKIEFFSEAQKMHSGICKGVLKVGPSEAQKDLNGVF